EFARNTAISVPAAIAPARYAPSGPTPSPKPTAIGAKIANTPGVASSRSESRVQMSTTRPYSGRPVPSMIPGMLENCRRTSKTTAPAARPTAEMARPENRKTTDAPISKQNRLFGSATLSTPQSDRSSETESISSDATLASSTAPSIASVQDPNSAVAARTAVAIVIPFVIAFVVLPTASSSVRIWAPSSSTSPDISAMPWALSLTGPNVSIATMTPTVVSRPQPARATANNDTMIVPLPSRNAP